MFLDFFCNPLYFQCKEISVTGYECFKEFFMRVNILKKNIKNEEENMIVLSNSLDGTMVLWNIAFDSSNEQITSDAINLLIEINFSIWQRRKMSLLNITQNFISTATELVNKDLSVSRVEGYLSVILEYVERFEKLGYSKINKAQYEKSPYTTRKCIIKNYDGVTYKELNIKLQNDMTLKDLKEAISYNLKTHKDKFIVYSNKQRLDKEYDLYYISEFSNFE